MKRFIATIREIDLDYRSYVGSEDIAVDSWKEAESICKSKSWTGSSFSVKSLLDMEDNKVYGTYGSWKNKFDKEPPNVPQEILEVLKKAAEAEKDKHTYTNPHFLQEINQLLYDYYKLEDDEVGDYIQGMFGA